MTTIQPEYEALGIHPDTMTCIAVLSKRDAKEYVWSLATHGIHAIASKEPVAKTTGRGGDRRQPSLWHVAVRGGLAYNPAAYFASIRGEEARFCMSDKHEQHPLVVKEDE